LRAAPDGPPLPQSFDEVLQRVFALADPALTGLPGGRQLPDDQPNE
jgi:hypothetical protein